MTSLQCIHQHDGDERSDSSRCFETAAQYCSRYMDAVARLEDSGVNDEDFNSGSSSGGSFNSSSGGSFNSSSGGSFNSSSGGQLAIAFKQSCGGEAHCWLYGQVIRFTDDAQDNALIQVFAPVHMRYYNVVSASHNLSIVAFACISLKASRANVLLDHLNAPSNNYCYSYHPGAAEPGRKRMSGRAEDGNQHNGKRRLSAAMVLLSPPPPRQQLQRKEADIDIDFDQDFAFMPAADCLELNFDQCDLDNDNEGITAEELLALFNASEAPADTPAVASDASDGDDDLFLPAYAGDEYCNRGDDDSDDDI
jgi:hypothetical protein